MVSYSNIDNDGININNNNNEIQRKKRRKEKGEIRGDKG